MVKCLPCIWITSNPTSQDLYSGFNPQDIHKMRYTIRYSKATYPYNNIKILHLSAKMIKGPVCFNVKPFTSKVTCHRSI